MNWWIYAFIVISLLGWVVSAIGLALFLIDCIGGAETTRFPGGGGPPGNKAGEATALCLVCRDEGWVCEDHPTVPWRDGRGCCGGAGMLCPACRDSGDLSLTTGYGFSGVHETT